MRRKLTLRRTSFSPGRLKTGPTRKCFAAGGPGGSSPPENRGDRFQVGAYLLIATDREHLTAVLDDPGGDLVNQVVGEGAPFFAMDNRAVVVDGAVAKAFRVHQYLRHLSEGGCFADGRKISMSPPARLEAGVVSLPRFEVRSRRSATIGLSWSESSGSGMFSTLPW